MRHLAAVALLAVAAPAAAQPAACMVAKDGAALHRVVVGATATDRTKAAAKALADQLGRVTGGRFAVADGDGTTGLAVGRAADFPALKLAARFAPADITRREEYVLRTHADGAWLVGATDLAVEHAVWDFLHRAGYRQFFPSRNWEVVPRQPSLTLTADTFEKPDYHARRVWYGFGPADYAAGPYADWCAKNRAGSGVVLNTGHAYDGILARNRAAFAAHPEYLGLLGGQRKSSKFCVSNPELRALVAADAVAQLDKNPAADSVSVDPSDGGGWCECPECKKLGSVSDRAVTLANAVAEAVQARHPGRLVGMYAYSEHSPPPSIAAHPNVVVSVATGFIRGGYSVDQLLAGWGAKAKTLGVREYYSVNTWDRDLPGAARGGRLGYLKQTIPHFRATGARFMSAEASDNWGPNGLGYFVAARLLWDVKEADTIDAQVADFLDKCFGPAKAPMGDFYKLLTGEKAPLLCDDTVGRTYRLLADARGRVTDPAVHARLDDLTGYVRYVELWLDYSTATGPARQAAFEQLIRHSWAIRASEMVHTKGLYRDLPSRDKSVTVPTDAAWGAPEKTNPWKAGPPLTRADYEKMTAAGIASRKLLDFTPVSFTTNLVPAAPLNLPDAKAGTFGLYSRGVRTYYTWADAEPATFELKAKAGIVYDSRGPAKIDLFPVAEPEGKAVAHADVTPDKADHPFALKTTFAGLHRVEVTDAGQGTNVLWPAGRPVTVVSSPDAPADLHGRWTLVFYVPKGTKQVGGFASGPGALLDPAGKKVHEFDAKPGYFSIPVPPGADGAAWTFSNTAGRRLLMTAPPCLARSPRELLLPAEVVAADRRK
ncbi:MAG TPA: DUF4838 domain-containing protein [Urbifossiella sp.]|nr:DUF4838 domain-containing protein [Urbifossiella sp.]